MFYVLLDLFISLIFLLENLHISQNFVDLIQRIEDQHIILSFLSILALEEGGGNQTFISARDYQICQKSFELKTACIK